MNLNLRRPDVRRPIANGLASLVLLLAFSGCRIPCLQQADPAAPLPPNFAGAVTPESSAQTGIVEFFDDNVLTQLIVQGLAQNLELKARNQEIQIARNALSHHANRNAIPHAS